MMRQVAEMEFLAYQRVSYFPLETAPDYTIMDWPLPLVVLSFLKRRAP